MSGGPKAIPPSTLGHDWARFGTTAGKPGDEGRVSRANFRASSFPLAEPQAGLPPLGPSTLDLRLPTCLVVVHALRLADWEGHWLSNPENIFLTPIYPELAGFGRSCWGRSLRFHPSGGACIGVCPFFLPSFGVGYNMSVNRRGEGWRRVAPAYSVQLRARTGTGTVP